MLSITFSSTEASISFGMSKRRAGNTAVRRSDHSVIRPDHSLIWRQLSVSWVLLMTAFVALQVLFKNFSSFHFHTNTVCLFLLQKNHVNHDMSCICR